MFFEEDKNLDNLDDLELDFGEFEDKSVTWDELLEDDDIDLVSVKKDKDGPKKPKVAADDNEIVLYEEELDLDSPAKDAFEIFGGDKDLDLDDEGLSISITQEIDLSEEEVSPAKGTREIPQAGPQSAPSAAMDEYNFEPEQDYRVKPNKSAIYGAAAAIFLVVVIGVFCFFNMQGANKDDFATLLDKNQQAQEQPLVAAMKSEAGVEASVQTGVQTTGEVKKAAVDEKRIALDVTNGGRSNPFVPTGNINLAGFMTSPQVDIALPPEDYGNLEEVQKLMGITVTGILYDSARPSAIINVSGSDYFVQKGDKVDNYLVIQITPTNVTISSGKNTYKAGVGQPFDNGKIQGQSTLVQNRKFGGSTRQYTSTGDVEVNVREN